MILNTLIEIDWFDLVRRVNTREIRKISSTSTEYMWYSPVYTSVAREMITIAIDFYNSAVRYSDHDQSTVFVDFGGGSGKPCLIACESNTFSKIVSVDIDPFLVKRAEQNLYKLKRHSVAESVKGNVENREEMRSLFEKIKTELGSNYTLFVFNKNSYGKKVLENSLNIINQFGPRHVIYLYQNPIHNQSLLSHNYSEIQKDAKPNNAHKNFKYSLFWK